MNWTVEMLLANLRYRAMLARITRLANAGIYCHEYDEIRMRLEYRWYCACCQKCGRKPRP